MDDEFRMIPGFKDYRISRDGRVQTSKVRVAFKPHIYYRKGPWREIAKGQAGVVLYVENQASYRSKKQLIQETFGDQA